MREECTPLIGFATSYLSDKDFHTPRRSLGMPEAPDEAKSAAHGVFARNKM
jgi:hypothetical protein